jgi:hypothetical protein
MLLGMTQLASLLVVGTSVNPALVARVRPEAMHVVGRTMDAVRSLARGGHEAVVVDLDEPTARVVDAIYRLRDEAPITPMLVLARGLSRLLLNTAHQQRCEVLATPIEPAHLDGFLARARHGQRLSREQICAGLTTLSREYALDTHSTDFLAHTLGLPEACRAAPLELAPAEQHRQLRALLLKLGLRTVSGLHALLLRSAAVVRRGGEGEDEQPESLPSRSA